MTSVPLSGRVALVTGGGRGIGRAIALALAGAGADLAVNYRRDAAAAEEVVAAARGMGRNAHAVQATVGDPDETEALVEAVLAELGHVDILVSNAGIASRGLPVAETGAEEVERLLRTHALGAHQLCRLLLPSMRARPRGDIVVISSVVTALLPAGGAPYAMAKAALEALAMTLAKEERAHGIHVNVVAPGLVDTEMGRRLVRGTTGEDIRALDAQAPFGHVCRPEDVASVVRFLVSDEAGYLTGQRISVDGGGAWRAGVS